MLVLWHWYCYEFRYGSNWSVCQVWQRNNDWKSCFGGVMDAISRITSDWTSHWLNFCHVAHIVLFYVPNVNMHVILIYLCYRRSVQAMVNPFNSSIKSILFLQYPRCNMCSSSYGPFWWHQVLILVFTKVLSLHTFCCFTWIPFWWHSWWRLRARGSGWTRCQRR